jgi:hypothetical protein
MKRHVNVCRNETADAAPTLRSRSLLALAGAAIVLLGCQQDPGGSSTGSIDPSGSSTGSDTSPSGGSPATTDPQSATETDAGGDDDGGDGGDAGGGSGSMN